MAYDVTDGSCQKTGTGKPRVLSKLCARRFLGHAAEPSLYTLYIRGKKEQIVDVFISLARLKYQVQKTLTLYATVPLANKLPAVHTHISPHFLMLKVSFSTFFTIK